MISVEDIVCYPGSNNTIRFNVTSNDGKAFNGIVYIKELDKNVTVTDGKGKFEYIASDISGIYNLTYIFDENATHYAVTNMSFVNVTDFNVSVNKTLINNETIYVGDVVEFNITVTNDGKYVLDKVVVFDDNYTGLVLITGSYGSWTYDNGSWIYNGSLAAGESVTLTLKFNANDRNFFTRAGKPGMLSI